MSTTTALLRCEGFHSGSGRCILVQTFSSSKACKHSIWVGNMVHASHHAPQLAFAPAHTPKVLQGKTCNP